MMQSQRSQPFFCFVYMALPTLLGTSEKLIATRRQHSHSHLVSLVYRQMAGKLAAAHAALLHAVLDKIQHVHELSLELSSSSSSSSLTWASGMMTCDMTEQLSIDKPNDKKPMALNQMTTQQKSFNKSPRLERCANTLPHTYSRSASVPLQ